MSRIFPPEPEGAAESDPTLQVNEYLRLLLHRWRLLASFCVFAAVIGAIHYFVTPASYRATATLQIEQASVFEVGGERNPWLENWASLKYYPTQYRILRSRDVAERVVRDLQLMQHPAFAARTAVVDSEPAGASGDENAVARLAGRIQAATSIDPIQSTELVNLHYVASDPELAAAVANGLAQAFIDRGIESRSTIASRRSEILEGEILELRRKIQTLEGDLAETSRSTNLVNLDTSSNPNLQRLEELYSDLSEAVSDRIEKQIKMREIGAATRDGVADLEAGGILQQLRRELLDREQEYEAKRQIYKDDWPEMRDLKAEIDERRRVLGAEVDKYFAAATRRARAEYQSALQKERSLEGEIGKVTAAARNLNDVSVRFGSIQAEISAYREREDDLIRRLSEAGTSERLSGERASNVRVLEKALVPGAPFRPSLRQNLLVALGVGLALGIGLVLLVHLLDRTVKTSDELERLLGYPILGVIPHVGRAGSGYGYGRYQASSGEAGGPRRPWSRRGDREDLAIELLPARKPRLSVSEAYRSLRTALLLSSADELRVVTITSAEAGDGKTATALNLAVVLAQLGRKVLLIDGDLRRSRLHRVFDLSNRCGLVNYLTGGASVDEILLATEIEDLWVAPAGPHPPNPSELLASDRMSDLLTTARERFDMIIVDTPPALVVTDASLIGAAADGTVLCFRAGKTVREEVRLCRDRLTMADVKILGAILNAYHPRPGAGYRRGYRYYESYAPEIAEGVTDGASDAA